MDAFRFVAAHKYTINYVDPLRRTGSIQIKEGVITKRRNQQIEARMDGFKSGAA